MTIGRLVTKIDRAISSNTDRWIARRRDCIIQIAFAVGRGVWNRSDTPGNSIVLGNYGRLLRSCFMEGHAAATSAVRDVNCAICRRDFYVTMQTFAIGGGKHRGSCLAKNKSAVVTPKRACVRDALRSVINRIRIKRPGIGQRRMISAASEGLVVDVGRNNTVTGSEMVPIIIGNIDRRTCRG